MIQRRNVDYLRVSVTDRCNMRCIYCNPLAQGELADLAEILSADEICRVVKLCAELGITRIRLTGGEPLVRGDIVNLVREIASIAGITDLSLTTNGILLAPMASALKAAGLQRINVSLDAAENHCFRQLTRTDGLARVISGIHKAIEVGLTPVRINCVVLRSVNLTEVVHLAEMSLRLPVSLRFIEYCPPGGLITPMEWYVSNDDVRSLIESHLGPLSPVAMTQAGGPADYFRVQKAAGTIGFISGRSSMFCHRCSRLRLTCDGRLKPCLHCAKHYDLRTLLRDRASNDVVRGLISSAILEKGQYTKSDTTSECFSMQQVGG